MKQRLAAFATIFALIGGTGGAVALAGSGNQGNGGAAHGQYCEGHEKHHGKYGNRHKGDDCGQGDDNHGHEQGGHGGHH